MSATRGSRGRRGPLGSVRIRLVLLSFLITSAAVGFVYLYVVPQLSSSMTSERLERLEEQGREGVGQLAGAIRRGLPQRELGSLIRRTAANVDARVTLLGVRDREPAFVIGDSELESDAIEAAYPAAQGAVQAGAIRSAIETVRGRRLGETAIPVSLPGKRGREGPKWVIVLSTPLDDVTANVNLIARETLIAGGIALLAALLAAYLASGWHVRRLRRLERAAQRVAEGDFGVPIPVGARDEVGELAQTLDLMQRRLGRLDSARREFIANASHELRTPIASLGGFVELLTEDPEPEPEERRAFLRTMASQIERLKKLSTDLLDLSRLDAGAVELHPEDFEPTELAGAVAEEFSAAAEAHGTEIEVRGAPGPRRARADRARSMQIMRILLDNALKHTPPGTRITITSTIANNVCRLSVSDEGPGIEPRARDRVFERFYTADAVSGTGLGLAIARELARLMGGELELETRRRRTTFTLCLPVAGAPA